MKNYSLDEIKEELNKEIEGLEKLDPSYLNCRKCPFKGKCCIDNDIDIREDEWNEIKKILDSSFLIRQQVKQNFLKGRKCYFRTEKCCLLGEKRPTNCLYTPYQVIQNIYDGTITYNQRDESCNFITKEEKMPLLDFKNPYLKLENHYYLFLNHWFFLYENCSVDCYKMTGQERLKEYFCKDS